MMHSGVEFRTAIRLTYGPLIHLQPYTSTFQFLPLAFAGFGLQPGMGLSHAVSAPFGAGSFKFVFHGLHAPDVVWCGK